MEAKMDCLNNVIKIEMEAKLDGLNNDIKLDMEGLKDVIEEKMKGNMEDMKNVLKEDMEILKEGLKKLLQEMIPNGETVVVETHYEKKINVNHDFIDSNVVFKTHHIPKVDMRKFYGKDLVTWLL